MEPEGIALETAAEDEQAERIRAAGGEARNIEAVALALGGSFLLYRSVMQRRLRRELADKTVTPRTLYEINSRIFASQVTRIAWTMIPALVTGYRIGLREAGVAPISEEWLQRTAADYAMRLASNLHETSSEALISGFQTQLNRRVAMRAALDRTVDAFGVAPRTMKAIMNIWLAPPPKDAGMTSQPVPNRIKDRVDQIVAKGIARRAADVGETESYAAKNNAKAIVWLYLQQKGELPKDATKMWRTARDERVCPVCGPLHKVQVPLNAKFPVAGSGGVWGPSLHPRCRCDIVLRGAVTVIDIGSELVVDKPRELAIAKSVWGVVSKAAPGDPYDRDRRGRFAPAESRRLAYKEPSEMDPEVARILASLGAAPREVRATPVVRATAKVTATPRVTATPKISVVKPTAQPTGPVSATAERVSAERPMVAAISGEVKARNESVSAKVEQLAESKRFEAARAVNMPTNTVVESELWRNTPDNKPIYGIFKPDINNADSDLLWADDEVEWYTGGEHGRGVPSLQQGVDNYWKNEVLSEDALMRAWLDDSYAHGSTTDYEGDAMLVLQTDMMEYYIPYAAYEQAWKAAVYGLSREEAPDVTVLAVEMDWNEDMSDYDYVGEEETMLSLHTIADRLDINERVAELRPIVAKTSVLSTQADGYWGGIMTNPGKWRITHTEPGPSMDWHGRSATEPFSYTVVSVEPEDR